MPDGVVNMKARDMYNFFSLEISNSEMRAPSAKPYMTYQEYSVSDVNDV